MSEDTSNFKGRIEHIMEMCLDDLIEDLYKLTDEWEELKLKDKLQIVRKNPNQNYLIKATLKIKVVETDLNY
jgi:hypothetical protein